MLHGAFFTYAFGRQYSLASKYHIVVPHIMGYGRHTEKSIQTREVLDELIELIHSFGKKVVLVGVSLGAQLGYELLCETPESFQSAVIISPWLIKTKDEIQKMMRMNEKQFHTLQNKTKCNLIALMNGVPSSARHEFVNEMQNVTIETVQNSVNNGIVLSDAFQKVDLPVVALCGGKEPEGIKESVKRMSDINPNCRYEIWDKAAHNIPPMFACRLNALLEEIIGD